MSALRKVINLLTLKEKQQGLRVLILVVGMALFETVGVASIMPFLAVLGAPQMIESNPLLSFLSTNAQIVGIKTTNQFLALLGFGAFFFILISAVYRTLAQYYMNQFIEMRRHSIGVRLLDTFLQKPYSFFLDRHSSEMAKTILSEADQLTHMVIRPVFNMLAYILVLVGIASLLFLINFWLALLTLAILGGIYGIIFLGISKKLKYIGGVLVTSNLIRFRVATEVFGGIKDIKLLGREDAYLSSFFGSSEEYSRAVSMHQTLNQVPYSVIEAIAFGGILLICIILLVSAGGVSEGALGEILPIIGAYAFAAYRLKPALQNVFQGYAALRIGGPMVANMAAELHCSSNINTIANSGRNKILVKSRIKLEGLSYTYPKSHKPALRDLNLEIPVGSTLGIVGSTGAGKTTIVDVILGLLTPSLGNISVDGVVIDSNNLRSWQANLGYVPQQIFITDSTVAENIALGVPLNQINLKQVESCAKMAQIHDMISNELPERYATKVGERGIKLSGGQRQRLGIARALYHNPDVLVFDEATSALDGATESSVMAAINELSRQKKTTILIAHRLSTVRNCDKIILLENGSIKAVGTYIDLANDNEIFKKLANIK